MNNAIVMTAIYDKFTWHTTTINLWESYAKKIGADFILITDTGDIIPPTNYYPIYKLNSLSVMSSSDYEKILFVDCDTVVNDKFENVFDCSLKDVRILSGDTGHEEIASLEERHHKKIYYETLKNLGFDNTYLPTAATSVFMITPEYCEKFVRTLKEYDVWPDSNEVKDRIEAACYAKVYFPLCDQFFWSIFFQKEFVKNTSEICWPYSIYPEIGPFVTDLWNSRNRSIEKSLEHILEHLNG